MTKLPQNKSSNKITVYIIFSWLIVIVAVFAYYYTFSNSGNAFWNFPNKKAPVVMTIGASPSVTKTTQNQLYNTLSEYQNLEKITLKKSYQIRKEILQNNNTFYMGIWTDLNAFRQIAPDSIVSFNEESRLLNWKHGDGYYHLPLSDESTPVTYAIIARINHENDTQSLLFIQFEEADMVGFLDQMLLKEQINQLKEKLQISDNKTAFVALYKIGKQNSSGNKPELLEGYILKP